MPALIDDAAIALAAIGLGLSGINEILTFINSIKKVDELIDTVAKDLIVFRSILAHLQNWYTRYTSSASQWYGDIQALNNAVESCSQSICRTFRYFETKYGRTFNKNLPIDEMTGDARAVHAAKKTLRKMYRGTKFYFGGESALVDFRWELTGVKLTLSIALQLVQVEGQDRSREEHEILMKKLDSLEAALTQANHVWAPQVNNAAKPEPLRRTSDILLQTAGHARRLIDSRRGSRADSSLSTSSPVLRYSSQSSTSYSDIANQNAPTIIVDQARSGQSVSTQFGQVQVVPATLAFRGSGFTSTWYLDNDPEGVLEQIEDHLRTAYRTSGRPAPATLDYSQGAMLHALRMLPRQDAYIYVNLSNSQGGPPSLVQILQECLQLSVARVPGGRTEVYRLPYQWDVCLAGQSTSGQTVLGLRPVQIEESP